MTDEYEVELIDYLRVLWRWKWLILGVLAIGVTVAAVVSFTQPDRYAGTAGYELKWFGATLGLPAPTAADLVHIAEADSSSEIGAGLSLSAKADKSSNSGGKISVTISGAVAPERIEDAFETVTSALRSGVEKMVEYEIQRTTMLAAGQKEQLTKQKELLLQEMENATSSDLSSALAEQVAALSLKLAQVQVQLEGLRSLDPSALFVVERTGEVAISRVGPHRAMNIAVAAVLSGFVGILLAFFLNYILSYRKNEVTS